MKPNYFIRLPSCSECRGWSYHFNRTNTLSKLGYVGNYKTIMDRIFDDESTYLSVLPREIQAMIDVPINLHIGCYLSEPNVEEMAYYAGCFEYESIVKLYYERRVFQETMEEIYFDEDLKMIQSGYYYNIGIHRREFLYFCNNGFRGINMYNLYVRHEKRSSCNVV